MASTRRHSLPRSTGTVYVPHAITPGNTAVVLWVKNREAAYVGFLWDAAASGDIRTPTKADYVYASQAIAKESGMAIFGGDGEFSSHQVDSAVLEWISWPEIIERFGEVPAKDNMFIDEGGLVGSYAKAFMCADGIESQEAVEYHREARGKAIAASLLMVAATAAIIAATCLLASAYAADAREFVIGIITVWAIILSVFGVWMLGKVYMRAVRAIYRKLAYK